VEPRAFRLRALRHVGALLAALLIPCATLATLGEPVASVAADRRALAAKPGAHTDLGGFTVETVMTGAATVREYVATSGMVFAIAWSGLAHPDLGPLLGSYQADYRDALQQAKRTPGRRRAQLQAGRLVVERWGHMRDLHGLAYAPALVPPGVAVDDLR